MSSSDRLSIGQRIRSEREARSWSQSMLAEKIIAVTEKKNVLSEADIIRRINYWESDTHAPSPFYREKLCRVFGKPLEEWGLVKSTHEESAPIWNVPYSPNWCFTGRKEILEQIHKNFTSTQQPMALTQPHNLSGLGGIGKTQIAVEYAYRYGNTYKYVLWVNAAAEQLATDLVKLAILLNLPEKDEQDQNKIKEAVKIWLQRNKEWLLILDNVEDSNTIAEFLQMPPKFAHVPIQETGHILITTRLQPLGENVKNIEIKRMAPEEGVLFLLRRVEIIANDDTLEGVPETKRNDATTLHTLLDGLPLALDQAGAYIVETPSCSVQEYINLYEIEHKRLLERRGSNDQGYPKSVAVTWKLNFDQVEQNNPAAAELLRLFAFLAPDDIPVAMIVRGASELGQESQDLANNTLQFNEAIGELRKYSLIQQNAEAGTISIHRLVQTVLRDNIQTDEQCQWAEQAVQVVSRSFPDTLDVAQWSLCDLYLPHALTCARWIEQWKMESAGATRLLFDVGAYLSERGHYKEAEPLLAWTVRTHGTAGSLNNLAELYRLQGKYEDAEPLYKRALAIHEQQLGSKHPNTAGSLNNLAGLYIEQGKYEDAEPLLKHALAILLRTLGPEHPGIVGNLNNLAIIYTKQGKYEQAEALCLRAIAIGEQTLGPEHPDLAIWLNNLANLYQTQGKYEDAEPLYKRAIAIGEQTLGPEHPDTAKYLNNLAELYRVQGKYEDAEPLLKHALAILLRTLEPEHPYVRDVLENLAVLYYMQSKDMKFVKEKIIDFLRQMGIMDKAEE